MLCSRFCPQIASGRKCFSAGGLGSEGLFSFRKKISYHQKAWGPRKGLCYFNLGTWCLSSCSELSWCEGSSWGREQPLKLTEGALWEAKQPLDRTTKNKGCLHSYVPCWWTHFMVVTAKATLSAVCGTVFREMSLCRPHFIKFSSVQFSRSVMSESLLPHESHHDRPPCPSPTPGVHSNSRASSRWWHPAISSSVFPFSSCPQSLPASGSFPISQPFEWGGQSTGVSASASVLPMNTQDWSPLAWTSWISLQSKELSRVFFNTTVQKHQFFGAQPSSQSNSHIHTWQLEKP